MKFALVALAAFYALVAAGLLFVTGDPEPLATGLAAAGLALSALAVWLFPKVETP
jgi:hypothetical protein